MYGPGAPSPPRSAGTVIALRVLFTLSAFLSCGILACVPLFRVALLRGRWFNWAAAWASLPVSVACFAVIGTVPENDPRSDTALAVVLLLGAAAGIYFLVMDIRPNNRQSPYAGYAPPQAATVPAGYGYPPPSPYSNMRSGPQPPMPGTPIPPPPVSHGPVPPPPQRPAPARIDQVRAELDELSDYLRKHDSNGSGSGSGNGTGSGSHNGDGDREGGR